MDADGGLAWPIAKYEKPYLIVQPPWQEKDRAAREAEITDVETDPVIVQGPYVESGELQWEKRPGFAADFEPNQVNMFRIILKPNFVGSLEEHKTEYTGEDLPELYTLSLEKLKILHMTHEMMSTR